MNKKAREWSGCAPALVPAFLAAALAGCGGALETGTSTAPSPAQGAFAGTISNGNAFNALVLENNDYWGVYGTQSGDVLLVSGFFQGRGVANNGSFSSADLRDYWFNGVVQSGTLTASYNSGVSFNGSLSAGGATASFNSTAIPSAQYNYGAAASLQNIAGAWSMRDLAGAAVSVTVQTSGAFTGSSGACTFSGTITPRPSGKNVFNVSVSFGTAPCALPLQTATGIAVDNLLSSGRRQLIIAGTSGDRSKGTALIGQR